MDAQSPATPTEVSAKPAATPPPFPQRRDRYGLPIGRRLATSTSVAYFAGFFLGISHGGKTAALRFRAENSHRLPTSQRGWYIYHKVKNMYVVRASFWEGNKMGGKLAPWACAFFAMEEAVDRLRTPESIGRRKARMTGAIVADECGTEVGAEEQNRDFLSTTVAALGVAGGFSLWSRWPLHFLLHQLFY